MVIIGFTKNPDTVSELLAYNFATKLIDDWIVIASASLSFLSGVLLCWKTAWGFFKHWWVAVKFILTFALLILGTFWLGKWTNESVYMVRDLGEEIYSNETYSTYQSSLNLWGTIQVGALVFLYFISVFKPWKRLIAEKK